MNRYTLTFELNHELPTTLYLYLFYFVFHYNINVVSTLNQKIIIVKDEKNKIINQKSGRT